MLDGMAVLNESINMFCQMSVVSEVPCPLFTKHLS